MKRETLMVLLVLISVFTNGATITYERALQLAESFLRENGTTSSDGVALARDITQTAGTLNDRANLPQLKLLSMSPTDNPDSTPAEAADADYYLFNVGDHQGFVIIAGDDRLPPVLGYSDQGGLDPQQLPCGLKELLEAYSALIGSGLPVTTAKRSAIAPIVKTKWHQNNPYNMKAPTAYYNDGIYRCAAGCLAVAMAQAMSVYKWPSKVMTTIPGYENKTTWEYQGVKKTAKISTTEAGTKIDWANALDNYTGQETVVQQQAVSYLMLYCGASVETDYDVSSGAVTQKACDALKKYFGYSYTTYYDSDKGSYSSSAWEDIIYTELDAGRPVIMAGQNNKNLSVAQGHSFICDGYDGNGKYHINWGWNNGSDGYFLLTGLTPPQQGTGGASGGYNYHQEIICGIVPDNNQYQAPQDPTPTGAVTEKERADLSSSLTETIQQITNNVAVCQEYEGKFTTLKQKADEQQRLLNNQLNEILALQAKANRDDIDPYYYLLLDGCVTSINAIVKPKLETAATQIDNGLSFCQTSAVTLQQLKNTLSSLTKTASTVTDRETYNTLKDGVASAQVTLGTLDAAPTLSALWQQQDFQLRDVENLRMQIQNYFDQVKPALLQAIAEADAAKVPTGIAAYNVGPEHEKQLGNGGETYNLNGQRVTPQNSRKGQLRIVRQKDGRTRKVVGK